MCRCGWWIVYMLYPYFVCVFVAFLSLCFILISCVFVAFLPLCFILISCKFVAFLLSNCELGCKKTIKCLVTPNKSYIFAAWLIGSVSMPGVITTGSTQGNWLQTHNIWIPPKQTPANTLTTNSHATSIELFITTYAVHAPIVVAQLYVVMCGVWWYQSWRINTSSFIRETK